MVCSYGFDEHGEGPVATLSATELDLNPGVKVWELVTDADDPADKVGTVIAVGFPDYGRFKIGRKTGVLTFKSPPDYENPRDKAADENGRGETAVEEGPAIFPAGEGLNNNVYKVKAKVGDGEKFLAVEITVRVTGIEELGTITLSDRRPEVGEVLIARLEDPDGGDRNPDWQWEVENGTGGFDAIDEAVNASYTPLAEHVGKKLRATAEYVDSHETDYALVTEESEFPVRSTPDRNVAPVFVEAEDEVPGTGAGGEQATRRIEENTPPGMNVGPAVLATDKDHLPADDPDDPGGPRDELTYSLEDITALEGGYRL